MTSFFTVNIKLISEKYFVHVGDIPDATLTLIVKANSELIKKYE